MTEHRASMTENDAKSTHFDETHDRMNYRIQNEINDTTIFVFKVLPEYYSDATNKEKGCGVMLG